MSARRRPPGSSGPILIEIAPLAEQVNRLAGSKPGGRGTPTDPYGNLAHALKTPLSVSAGRGRTGPGAAGLRISPASVRDHEGQVDHHLRRVRAAARGAAHGLGERTPVAEVDELAVSWSGSSRKRAWRSTGARRPIPVRERRPSGNSRQLMENARNGRNQSGAVCRRQRMHQIGDSH
jgi:hypothetical protein